MERARNAVHNTGASSPTTLPVQVLRAQTTQIIIQSQLPPIPHYLFLIAWEGPLLTLSPHEVLRKFWQCRGIKSTKSSRTLKTSSAVQSSELLSTAPQPWNPRTNLHPILLAFGRSFILIFLLEITHKKRLREHGILKSSFFNRSDLDLLLIDKSYR